MSEYMIMLNSACNLRCPYCFASETMTHVPGEMSIERFHSAIEFALKGVQKRGIGIIGGEPTIHSCFDEMIQILVNDERVESVDIFTNGTTLTAHISAFKSKKVHVLINCNPPDIIGNDNYQKVISGIDALFSAGVSLDRIGLGINIDNVDMNYGYFLNMIERYSMDTVRVSVSVPQHGDYDGNQRFLFFEKYLPKVKEFVVALLDRGVVPVFDCNKIPPCLLRSEGQILTTRYGNDERALEALRRSNYLNGTARCTPSIVVDHNLEAIRCFALSRQTRMKIDEFDSLSELQRYYARNVDCLGYIPDHVRCTDCEELMRMQCMGGCMIFKATCTESGCKPDNGCVRRASKTKKPLT